MNLAQAYEKIKEDFSVVFKRDPAARSLMEVLFCYPGLHAMLFHRVACYLWRRGLKFPARFISHVSRLLTGIEIHPGAVIGSRFFIDHGAGVVIGETSEIGDDVVLYQGVTLGGVSLSKGKRHPTIDNEVVIGAGAKILGPVHVGAGSMVGAGSVVVKDLPEGSIAAGVPAKVISKRRINVHEISLRHDRISDPRIGVIKHLEERIYCLEKIVFEDGKNNAEKAKGF